MGQTDEQERLASQWKESAANGTLFERTGTWPDCSVCVKDVHQEKRGKGSLIRLEGRKVQLCS